MKKAAVHIYVLIPLLIMLKGNFNITNTNPVNVDDQSQENSINKLLVLVLSPIDETRETAEKELVYWLRKGKYDATASYDILTVRGRLPVREEVRRVIEKNNFDGVLAIRLVDFKENSRFVSSSEKNTTTLNETYFYNYLKAWNGNYKSGYYSNVRLMVIESSLYVLPKGEIVHSMVSESFISDSFEGFVEDFSKASVKGLKRTKILVKNLE